MKNNRKKAVLIIGPTGAGKTPLGEIFEKQGLWGRKCFHFDFGDSLRLTASGKKFQNLMNDDDITYIKKVLTSGALLENETFHIAEKILHSFIEENKMLGDDVLVINGLPRHRDQADDVTAIIDITSLIHLECTPEVIFERIRLNTG